MWYLDSELLENQFNLKFEKASWSTQGRLFLRNQTLIEGWKLYYTFIFHFSYTHAILWIKTSIKWCFPYSSPAVYRLSEPTPATADLLQKKVRVSTLDWR